LASLPFTIYPNKHNIEWMREPDAISADLLPLRQRSMDDWL